MFAKQETPHTIQSMGSTYSHFGTVGIFKGMMLLGAINFLSVSYKETEKWLDIPISNGCMRRNLMKHFSPLFLSVGSLLLNTG